MNIADVIGIIGVLCYQAAYAGLQFGRLQRDDRSYVLLNLFGPICLLYSLLFHFNLAAVISQFLWLAFSYPSVVKVLGTRNQLRNVAPVVDCLSGRSRPKLSSVDLASESNVPQVGVASLDCDLPRNERRKHDGVGGPAAWSSIGTSSAGGRSIYVPAASGTGATAAAGLHFLRMRLDECLRRRTES
jgi:hypothetical protein